LKLFGTKGSSSECIIHKDGKNFERAAMDVFKCKLDHVGIINKLRVTILPKDNKNQYRWFLEKIQFVKQNEKQEKYIFSLNDWISQKTDYHYDISLINGGNSLYDVPKSEKSLLNQTTYRVIIKTSDINGAGTDSNVFIVISGIGKGVFCSK
jgi:hypothetical protein